ncbi:MAG: hypothetical protein GY715_14840 [Planctomycetes bacterium]|nr:hypothetical protein [Planctomycetota bacterium]
MFERLTDRARKSMAYANQEAQRLQSVVITTEHILLGLLKEGTGTAVAVLASSDVDLAGLSSAAETLAANAAGLPSFGKLPQSPPAKKVIEHAIEEARGLNHSYVGTEHLLLGLLRTEDIGAARLLAERGIELEETRAKIVEITGGREPRPEDSMMGDLQRLIMAWPRLSEEARAKILAIVEAETGGE